MGSNNCSFKITTDVLPPRHRVNAHVNARDQQRAKTSASVDLVTLADDQLLRCAFD